MEISTFLIILGSSFLTSIVSAIAGFGAGILIVAVLSFFYDAKTAVALSTILFFFNNLNKIILYFRTVDWIFVRNISLGAVPACIGGLYVFRIIDPKIVKYLIAGVGILMLLDHLLPSRKIKKLKNFTGTKMVILGAIWGGLSGIAPVGILKAFILKLRGLSKHYFVGTAVFVSIFLDLVKLPNFIRMGFLEMKDFVTFAPIIFVSFVGTFVGKKVLGKISHEIFEKIVLIMVGIAVLRFLIF